MERSTSVKKLMKTKTVAAAIYALMMIASVHTGIVVVTIGKMERIYFSRK